MLIQSFRDLLNVIFGSKRRTAIITGTSHGIGAAIAQRLAIDGLAVVINYSSGPDVAEALVSQIQAAGGEATAVKADVSDPAAVIRNRDRLAGCLHGSNQPLSAR